MYSTLTLLFLLPLALAFNNNLPINRFLKLVVFGDSYSDTGNVYNLTNHTWPLVPPYYKGRYCNGPNWVDDLKILQKVDYAYGSATTDNNLVQGLAKGGLVPVPGIRQQVAQYLSNTPKIIFNLNLILRLHVIWGGGNDAIFNPTLTIPQIVNSLMNSVKDLLNAGVQHMLVVNQPPLQLLPVNSVYHQPTYFAYLTQLANSQILANLTTLKQSHPQTSIYIFDLYTFISEVVANTSSVKFADTVDPCWVVVGTTLTQYCSNATEYVFLDTIHYSSPVQALIAAAIQQFISIDFLKTKTSPYIISV